MRLLPRATGDLTSLATGLSLVIANYKPTPQLPTANDTGPSGSQELLPSSQGNHFQVQTPQMMASQPQRPEDEWGLPSVLYVPQTSKVDTETSGASSFAANAKTVGAGNCPVQSAYTPQGGWDKLPPPVYATFDPVMANVYRYRQQQGVDLGAWFVQEAWMSGSLFSCATGGKSAEYDVLDGFGQSQQGVSSAKAFMEKHWDTWITEADFQKMAGMGINTVRLPIGYWSAGPYFTHDSPFSAYSNVYEYSWRYVARAINWAAKYNIGVLVDLHAAYGSQNGQAHSGLSDGNIEFYNDFNMNLTTELLVWLAHEISNVTNVVGIQLLNEPQDRTSLWPWYTKTMDAMRNASDSSATVPLYFHDAFNLNKGASFVSKRSDFVVQDHHSYYVYTAADTKLSAKGHTKAINGQIQQWMATESDVARRNLVVGEWSCALNPASLTKSTNKSKDQRDFCNAQLDVYGDTASGYMFWSWKMENCQDNGGWCFQQAAGNSLPSTFDSWGLENVTAKFFAVSNASTQTNVDVLTRIEQIALPAQNGAKNVTSTLANVTNHAITAAQDHSARIGMVEKPLVGQRRGAYRQSFWQAGGSYASRARLAVTSPKRDAATKAMPTNSATSAASAASAAGFNDGFKSARFFAAKGNLSRLGFAQQYMTDSWAARLSNSQSKLSLQANNSDQYLAQFKAGLLAAEAEIARAILTT